MLAATLSVVAVMSMSTASAAIPISGGGGPPATGSCAKPKLFGVLVPWYEYLQVGSDSSGLCKIQFPSNPGAANEGNSGVLGAHSAFFLIALAVVDDMVRVAALIAVGYIIYAGVQYMTSGGSPEGTKKAQNTIINALIGLTLAIFATSIVTLVGHKLMNS